MWEKLDPVLTPRKNRQLDPCQLNIGSFTDGRPTPLVIVDLRPKETPAGVPPWLTADSASGNIDTCQVPPGEAGTSDEGPLQAQKQVANE